MAGQGDATACSALYRRHAVWLRRRVFGLLGPGGETDDVVLESFLRAFEGLGRLTEPQPFAVWLSTIAVHLVYRRLKRRALGFAPSRAGRHQGSEAASGPAAAADLTSEVRAIYAVLDRLPTDSRVTFLLRRLEGLSLQEIAVQTGLTPIAVKLRIELAHRCLAPFLDLGPDPLAPG